jgi:hypothetical protein
MASTVISKFLHSTVLVTISAKTELQFKVDKNPTWLGSWIMLDALFSLYRRVCWPALEECYGPLQRINNYFSAFIQHKVV